VFDIIGGDIWKRSSGLSRTGGTLVPIAGLPEAPPADGLAVNFVVLPDRAELSEVVRRVRDRRLRTIIGNASILDDAMVRNCPVRQIILEHHGKPSAILRLIETPLSSSPVLAGHEFLLAG